MALGYQGLQARILSYQARFALALLMDLQGFGGLRQKLIAPLVGLGLAALVLRAQLGHGLALKALDDEQRCGVGLPLPSGHD
jgi:hypothetical protein